jgi:hypothetical protein
MLSEKYFELPHFSDISRFRLTLSINLSIYFRLIKMENITVQFYTEL